MNGRTAQDSRIPVNGTAAKNGTNGHAPSPESHPGQVSPADQEDNRAEQAGQGAAGKPAETPAWVEEYAARRSGRVATVPARAEFETPVRVDEIAVAAKALSENLQAATRGMPESPELRALRRDLDQAASTLGSVAGALEATAGNLIRLAATEGRSCGVGWGVCPEHGLTLMNVGETVTCHVLGCHRENEGAVERCEHPVVYRVVDAAGPALLTCAGHAIACRLYLDDTVITLASDSLELF
ncbi:MULTISPECIES: hypothetical protein [unclassified Kribbella]|uniref:hypothetical protein n=1 Tax=unclassified Kribbella TaxID=2644121 RepID=UPI003015D186